MLILRFDMRAPDNGAATSELYACAIEMYAWVENHGAVLAMLASGIAARTVRLAILLAAVVIPFWDPVRLAEEMSD